ncbi:hypothetical protein [Poseidonibacter sp.]|uniref:hypothetical protein n=1 Tax=Poseidonibacter sp. TaxID=2321188 RepID=UPI003C735A73
MYTLDLVIHSWLRWLISLSLIVHLYFIYSGYFNNKKFTNFNKYFSHLTVALVHTQFILGTYLYFTSETMSTFFANVKDSMAIADLRFFAVEHTFLMLIAVILITIGSFKSKRKTDDKSKYKTQLVFYTIAFIIMLIAIPWDFSPFAQRPYFRF